MNFASDNVYGVSDKIMQALADANRGTATSYGADALTKRVEQQLADIFEHEVSVFLVATGTAANALAVATYTPPYGAVVAHKDSHLMVDECGAPEFYSGAKLIGVAGRAGRVTLDGLSGVLASHERGNQHSVQPAMLSLTQATEAGTVYRPADIAALAKLAHANHLAVHMDGARFANALVSLNASPAEMTWRAGVDILSFGATKNGAMGAEAIVVFNPAHADDLMYRRKRAGHLISKSRFVAAQMSAYLDGDHWLDLARRANALARKLAEGIEASGQARLLWPVEANEMFPIFQRNTYDRLQQAGATFYKWAPAAAHGETEIGSDEVLTRLICSFATQEADIDRFLECVGSK